MVPLRTVVATALGLLVIGAASHGRAAGGKVPEVTIGNTRLTLGDVAVGIDAVVAAVDLGPAPAPGASRLLLRAEILAALATQGLVARHPWPSAVRVTRKMKTLGAAELGRITRQALAEQPMPRGVTLAAVRAPARIQVADGWSSVHVELPRPPRRVGRFATTAMVSFLTDGDPVAVVAVPVDLALGPDAARRDQGRGDPVNVRVRRGLVEVTIRGLASAEADVGDMLPVLLRSSGRTLQAQLIEPGLAELVQVAR